jgi:hypothetical protein
MCLNIYIYIYIINFTDFVTKLDSYQLSKIHKFKYFLFCNYQLVTFEEMNCSLNKHFTFKIVANGKIGKRTFKRTFKYYGNY